MVYTYYSIFSIEISCQAIWDYNTPMIVDNTSSKVGSVVNATCMQGYKFIVDKAFLVCQCKENGTWYPPLDECEGRKLYGFSDFKFICPYFNNHVSSEFL